MAESPIIYATVFQVDRVAGKALVVVEDVTTWIYPVDGALPEPGYKVPCVRSGGDLIPIASSQRTGGTFRGAVEADSFVGISETTIDSYTPEWTWTPLANTSVVQPTTGVDPGYMRVKRLTSIGRAQVTITIPIGVDRRYQAIELSCPSAATTGRDCFAEVRFLNNGVTIGGPYLYHVDNLYADARAVQSEPLLPPVFTTDMKVSVWSESTTLPINGFFDARLRAWTVPVFQGGAVLDLDGNVLMDHRGIILNGFPLNDEPRILPMQHGVNIWDFPLAFTTSSEYSYKPLGSLCQINLSFEATSGSAVSTQARFKLPFVARKHSMLNAEYLDQGNRWWQGSAHCNPGSDICDLKHDTSANNGNVNHVAPFTWGSGDLIIVSGLYPIVLP